MSSKGGAELSRTPSSGLWAGGPGTARAWQGGGEGLDAHPAHDMGSDHILGSPCVKESMCVPLLIPWGGGCFSQAVLSLEVVDKALSPAREEASEGVRAFSCGLSRTPHSGSWWGAEPNAKLAQPLPSTEFPAP